MPKKLSQLYLKKKLKKFIEIRITILLNRIMFPYIFASFFSVIKETKNFVSRLEDYNIWNIIVAYLRQFESVQILVNSSECKSVYYRKIDHRYLLFKKW